MPTSEDGDNGEKKASPKLSENIRDGGLIAGGCLTIKTVTEIPPPVMEETYYDDFGFGLGFALIVAGAAKLLWRRAPRDAKKSTPPTSESPEEGGGP